MSTWPRIFQLSKVLICVRSIYSLRKFSETRSTLLFAKLMFKPNLFALVPVFNLAGLKLASTKEHDCLNKWSQDTKYIIVPEPSEWANSSMRWAADIKETVLTILRAVRLCFTFLPVFAAYPLMSLNSSLKLMWNCSLKKGIDKLCI